MRTWVATIVASAFIPVVAFAQATLEIDDSSHFHFPSLGLTGTIPSGSLPIEILNGKLSKNSGWDLRIDSSTVELPPWTLTSGEKVRARMTEDAKGRCNSKRNRSHCSIQMSIAVRSGTNKPQLIKLTFSTGKASKTVGGITASRKGKDFDRASQQIELVATGQSPPGISIKAAQPFYVVLAGTLRGTP